MKFICSASEFKREIDKEEVARQSKRCNCKHHEESQKVVLQGKQIMSEVSH
ncbi:chromosome segregation protein SMC [Sesbania bispinosa]|nr:chromosome segregation protein SMC [Sesbania bispinosa]